MTAFYQSGLVLYIVLCFFRIKAVPKGCDGDVDLVFGLDSSESVLDPVSPGGQHALYTWDLHKAFIKAAIQNLPVGLSTKVSTIAFSSIAEVIFHFNTYENSINIQDAISGIQFMGGNTNTVQLLRKTQEEVYKKDKGERPTARNVLVILTDGLFNVNVNSVMLQADALKSSDIEIYTVASGIEIYENHLAAMASKPANKYFLHTRNISELSDLVNVLVHRICGLPDPNPVPTEPPGCEVAHCVDCRGELCQACTQGMYFNGTHCVVCEVKADLTVLMDDSGSIRDKNPADGSYDNYQLLKEFVKKLLQRLDIGPDDTRVSVIRFSTTAKLEFGLDEYSSVTEMSQVVDDFPYSRGHTNISGALRTMRRQVYLPERGDRKNVLNVGLVITDGESTRDSDLTILEAELAKEAGITLFVVGVTDEVNEKELWGIASDPDSEHYFNSTAIVYLDQILTQVTKYVCAAQSNEAIREKRGVGDFENGENHNVHAHTRDDHYVNIQDRTNDETNMNSFRKSDKIS